MTPKSTAATMNVKRILEEYLKGRYHLEVVDIRQQPQLAKNGEILAIPTLLKRKPGPIKKIIGDFSNEERVLIGLNLQGRTG
jgi:circadian clock protein KaiB